MRENDPYKILGDVIKVMLLYFSFSLFFVLILSHFQIISISEIKRLLIYIEFEENIDKVLLFFSSQLFASILTLISYILIFDKSYIRSIKFFDFSLRSLCNVAMYLVLPLIVFGATIGILSLTSSIGNVEINKNYAFSFAYFLLFFLVAISEEIFFRGVITRLILLKTGSIWMSSISSAAVFVLFHVGNNHVSPIGLLNLFLAGIILSFLFVSYGNLFLPIIFHFSWNYSQGPIFGSRISGVETNSLYDFEIFESDLLNGGKFGLEASIIITIALLLLLATLFFFKHKSNLIKVSLG